MATTRPTADDAALAPARGDTEQAAMLLRILARTAGALVSIGERGRAERAFADGIASGQQAAQPGKETSR